MTVRGTLSQAAEAVSLVRNVALQTDSIMCVVGARPNFMKIAPLMAAFRQSRTPLPATLVHTGQHYDKVMKEAFFNQLGIPEPQADLEVGSASHAVQTAEIMRRFEPLLEQARPRAVLVVGDVNSTVACALVAAKKGVPVIHVEAGLRSFDRSMPEEINRVLTDQLSDLLFTTEASALDNLRREGIDSGRVHFVGNLMIDTLLANKARAVPFSMTVARYVDARASGLRAGGYAVLTLHRPSNVDNPTVLKGLIDVVDHISDHLPIVFAAHPRTTQVLEKAGLTRILDVHPHIFLIPPLGYLEMLGLMKDAKMVLTDSGGMQEETTALGVPCITLRESTERPITVEQGTNTVTGRDAGRIMAAVEDVLRSGGKRGCRPELWDGKTAIRIRDCLVSWYAKRSSFPQTG